MKSIKTFEGFFNFLKGKEHLQSYYWFKSEIDDLSSLGFIPKNIKDPSRSEWMLDSDNSVCIKKVAFESNDREDYFYSINNKRFDSWTDIHKYLAKNSLLK